MPRNALWSKAARIVVTLALVLGLIPALPSAASAAIPASVLRSDEEIEAALACMLEVGDYVEGEAIVCRLPESTVADDGAVGQTSAAEDALANAEELSVVTAEQYDEAIEEAAQEDAATASLTVEDVLPGQEDSASVQISIVRDDDLSTEELIRQLLHDPQVLSAEPNYLMSATDEDEEATPSDDGGGATDEGDDVAPSDDGDGATDADEATPSDEGDGSFAPDGEDTATEDQATPLTAQAVQAAPDARGANTDLTGYQWFSTGAYNETQHYPSEANPGVHVPDWDDAGKTNASGVVVIMDSGVDYTHPDLENVVYHFTPDLQAQLGCGEFGYAPGREDPTDPMDGQYHGTHCAGVVAAEWNGFGVSGTANGVKICAIAISNSTTDSNYSYETVIKGYDFMIRAVDAGVDIRAVNRSFTSAPTNNAEAAMVQAAGEKGIVTCIASSNSGRDLEEAYDETATLQSSPYLLLVNASTQQDDRAGFSNYGRYVTDVFAPGSGILSTIPTGTDSSWTYFPQADTAPLLYETTFDSSALPDMYRGGWDDEGNETLESLDVEASAYGVDGESSAMTTYDGAFDNAPITFYVDIPTPATDITYTDIQDISVALHITPAGEETRACGRRYTSLAVLLDDGTEDGSYSEFDPDLGTDRGTDAIYGWNFAAMHLGETTLPNDLKYIQDSHGRSCIRLRISTYPYLTGADDYQQFDIDIYLDQVAIGKRDNDGYLPYRYMNGTSMATPCVTACAAIVSSGVSSATLADRAAQTVRILKGAVRQTDGYQDFCQQNGQIDLSRLGSEESYAPVLESADASGSTLVLKGAYFGQAAGTLMVGGVQVQPTSWSAGAIEAPWPADVSSGLVPIVVEASNGAVAQRAFMLTAPTSAIGVYERDLTAPSPYGDTPSTMTAPSSIVATEDGVLFAACNDDSGNRAPDSLRYLMRSDDQGASWTAIKLPQDLKGVHLAAGDGSVYLLGATPADQIVGVDAWHLYRMDVASGTFELLRSYNPDGGEVITESALAYVNSNLYVIDLYWGNDEYTTEVHMRIRRLDDSYTPVDALVLDRDYSTGVTDTPKVSVAGSHIYICGINGSTSPTAQDYTYGLDRIDVGPGGELSHTDLSSTLAGLGDGVSRTDVGVVADDHGVFLIGNNLDGLLPQGAEPTDTFYLERGATSFVPWGKALSRAPVYYLQGVSMGGQIYVFAYSQYEDNPVLGRATQASAHEWGETTYAWSEDYGQCTATRTCQICGEVETETVRTTSAVSKEPTTSAEGVRRYTAVFASSWAQEQTVDVAIPKLTPSEPDSGGGSPSRVLPATGDEVPSNVPAALATLACLALAAALFVRRLPE